ncbi:MAG: hypothetical protein NZT61_07945, partial [Deltaproteobacteria bacterium]|nr:hypothetical protein [Deltaproteobacteria bacterium]
MRFICLFVTIFFSIIFSQSQTDLLMGGVPPNVAPLLSINWLEINATGTTAQTATRLEGGNHFLVTPGVNNAFAVLTPLSSPTRLCVINVSQTNDLTLIPPENYRFGSFAVNATLAIPKNEGYCFLV